ncbi:MULTISPECIES: alpha/beta hydrolase [unclassified Leptolyngbya]|uniref:alpha/beta fold hydrolase n=1 Tax=unclassified Leptolyngbya TaxID=2650499 RepID=UPI00168385CE|nr:MULTISPECIES: alpha/beta hydrolase [unclassified Leptolyngbya]MBD1909380.1 alpha/beta hydrolase [Leptolyngbya sp. FACHB-8]MBD2158657.1 alpha/beta hydrolase [Leptolyngbya sp. FACHB-16]
MPSKVFKRNNVVVLGQGEQTIIFAHGFGSDQTAWRHQVEAFQSDYRIVLFDHVGAGKSDMAAYSPHRYSSLYSYAEDLLELCAELKLSQAILVGHSVSGMVSLLAALVDPSRFKQLIFMGASPRYVNDANTSYIGGFEQSDLDALYEAMSSNYYAWVSGFAPIAMGNPDRPELATEFANTLAAIRPDIAQAVSRVIFQSDHRAELPRLKVPTTILQSNNDVAVPLVVGDYLAKHIPNSKLININAQGHLPHISAPHVVTQTISECLAA